jgi:hypothetical protein
MRTSRRSGLRRYKISEKRKSSSAQIELDQTFSDLAHSKRGNKQQQNVKNDFSIELKMDYSTNYGGHRSPLLEHEISVHGTLLII